MFILKKYMGALLKDCLLSSTSLFFDSSIGLMWFINVFVQFPVNIWYVGFMIFLGMQLLQFSYNIRFGRN